MYDVVKFLYIFNILWAESNVCRDLPEITSNMPGLLWVSHGISSHKKHRFQTSCQCVVQGNIKKQVLTKPKSSSPNNRSKYYKNLERCHFQPEDGPLNTALERFFHLRASLRKVKCSNPRRLTEIKFSHGLFLLFELNVHFLKFEFTKIFVFDTPFFLKNNVYSF